jgi:hypothetical protein
MTYKLEDLKNLLKTLKIDWNDLFEAKFNSKTYTPPLYFGVYRVIYKPGYENAEANYIGRLNGLITHLDSLHLNSPRAIKCLEKIKAFQENLLTVDFRSEAFKADCRSSLLKHIRPLTRTTLIGRRNEIQETETIVDPKEFKIINKFYHQLSPFNYSYSYLTHFFYISDTDIKTLLVDDTKRKTLRHLGGIFELTSYIAELERPRRKHKTALSYSYLLMEGNPGLQKNESIIYGGENFSTNAGFGVLESWALGNKGVWKYKETFNHWRR